MGWKNWRRGISGTVLLFIVGARLAAASALVQLTGSDIRPGEIAHVPTELADPSPPFLAPKGALEIFGTGDHYLEYRTWNDLLSGRGAVLEPLRLLQPNGTPLLGHQGAWDIAPYLWSWNGRPTEVLYAGAMTATEGRPEPRWPEDNWNRRVYPFVKVREGWRQLPKPLFGEPKTPTWIGHCYGHHFITDDKNRVWIFYEKVTEERANAHHDKIPFRTELFARQMETPFRASDREIPILLLGNLPYPATQRHDALSHEANGYLIEGPRPTRVNVAGKTIYLLGFSGGDFPTDNYGLNVAWSKEVTGPYQPLLTHDGSDLKDFGADLRRRHSLSWGPGRPAFFLSPDGRSWALFHAVRKTILPDRDYTFWPLEPLDHFYRMIFLAPLEVSWKAGDLDVRIVD